MDISCFVERCPVFLCLRGRRSASNCEGNSDSSNLAESVKRISLLSSLSAGATLAMSIHAK